MIVLDVEQGTEEWAKARVGIPTASKFDQIVTSDGKPSKQRTKYLYSLAAEKVTGKPLESYQNEAMLRGLEMEAEARAFYELQNDVTVQSVGICYLDSAQNIGASPDGLVGDDGGLEIKCPMAATHVSYLLEKKLPTEYFQQVQGNLYVTGRKWWDFMSYYPGMKPFIVRVERDEKFIEALSLAVDEFNEDLAAIWSAIK